MTRNSETLLFSEEAIQQLEETQEEGRIQAIFRQFRRFSIGETPSYQSKVDLLQYLVDRLAERNLFAHREVADQNCMRVLFQIEQLSLKD